MKNSEYLILILLIYTDVLSGITSRSVSDNTHPNAEKRTSSHSYCNTVNFLLSSTFTQQCFSESIPTSTSNSDVKPDTQLCLELYDLEKQWCTKSSQNYNLPVLANATQFDSYVSKFESLDKVQNFCQTLKNSTYLSNEFTCLRYCLDPSTENTKPKKICSALAWLKTVIDSSITILQKPIKVPETKPGINKITAKTLNAKNTQEKNSVAGTKEGNTALANKNKTASTDQKNVSESTDKHVDILKTPSVLTAAEEQGKEELLNNVSTGQKVPDVNNDKQSESEQTPNKVEQNGAPEVPDSQKTSTSEPKTMNEPSNGKNEKGQQLETKTGVLSDNTNSNTDVRIGVDVTTTIKADSEVGRSGDNGLPKEIQSPTKTETFSNVRLRQEEEESHIFFYCVLFLLLCACCYIGYHNKKKILAILLEGRRSRNGRGKRRPSTASYKKLDCNLEEAVTSQCNSDVTHVIY